MLLPVPAFAQNEHPLVYYDCNPNKKMLTIKTMLAVDYTMLDQEYMVKLEKLVEKGGRIDCPAFDPSNVLIRAYMEEGRTENDYIQIFIDSRHIEKLNYSYPQYGVDYSTAGLAVVASMTITQLKHGFYAINSCITGAKCNYFEVSMKLSED
ncbi:MAG: hypothetical protein AB7H77_10560 [Bdellovibrionales bacterium]